jgi:hypothetical protein
VTTGHKESLIWDRVLWYLGWTSISWRTYTERILNFENIKKEKKKKYGAMLAGPETSFWTIDKPFNFFQI